MDMQKFFRYFLLVTISFGIGQLNAQCDSVCKNFKKKKDFWVSGVTDVTSYIWEVPPAGSNIIQSPSTGALNDTGHYDFSNTTPGIYAITVKAVNACGSVSKSFNINVVNICYNQKPIAVNDTVTTSKGYPIAIDVLKNDSDPDGDSLRLINPVVVLPKNGILVLLGTKWVYKPNVGFIGLDSFRYAITDGKGGFDSAWVYISIKQSVPIIAIDDHVVTMDNTKTGNVKDNDFIFITEPVLVRIIKGQSNPNSGKFTLNSDGTFLFVPAIDFEGFDSVLYELYTVTILGDTITSRAWVYLHNFHFKIPNAITPNNDGFSDNLQIIGLENLVTNDGMTIYNRWGDQVWNSEGAYRNSNAFGGRGLDDRILPDGTYFYIINIKYKDIQDKIIDEVKSSYIEVYR